MELVYAYIQKDDRIFKEDLQINFGSEYVFKGELDYEKNELKLTKTKNENFIPNYFGNNSKLKNITAIVGKNGSGKTTFLRKLFIDDTSSTIARIFIYKIENKYLFWTPNFDRKKELKINLYTIKVQINFDFLERVNNPNKSHSKVNVQPKFFFDNMFIPFNLFSGLKYNAIENIKPDIKNINGSINNQFSRFSHNNINTSLSLESSYQKHIFKLVEEKPQILNEGFIKIDEKWLFRFKESRWKKDYIRSLFNDFEKYKNEKLLSQEVWTHLENRFKNFSSKREDLKTEINLFNHSLQFIQMVVLKLFLDKFIHRIKRDINEKAESFGKLIIQPNNFLIFDLKHNVFNKPIEKDFLEEFNEFHKCFNGLTFCLESLSEDIKISDTQNFKDRLDFSVTFDSEIDLKIAIEIRKRIDKFYICLNKLTQEEYPINYNNNNLFQSAFNILPLKNYSSGEYNYIQMLSSIYHFSKSFKDNILILLDEVDLTFHPEWKKKFVSILVNDFPRIFEGKNIQIIYTTHSPITLSDMPSSNVVYLNKDKDGCFIDNTKNTKTMGANIHSLYKDSFFMEDGLMGNYAKNKIETLASFLKDEENDWKYESEETILIFIKQVGEPLIERELLRLFDIKYNLNELARLRRKNKLLEKEILKLNTK